jgi:hypothetical protein
MRRELQDLDAIPRATCFEENLTCTLDLSAGSRVVFVS